jgi:hypothetical protein
LVSWTQAYVRSPKANSEDYLEGIGDALDPEKFNDDFEDSLGIINNCTLESNLDLGTFDA